MNITSTTFITIIVIIITITIIIAIVKYEINNFMMIF